MGVVYENREQIWGKKTFSSILAMLGVLVVIVVVLVALIWED